MWKKIGLSLLVVILVLSAGFGGRTIRDIKVIAQAKVIELLEEEVNQVAEAKEAAVKQTEEQARLIEEALRQIQGLTEDKEAAFEQARLSAIAKEAVIKRAEAAELAKNEAIEQAERAKAAGLVEGEGIGYEKGYDEGYEVALASEVSRHNPTYQEMKEFVARDKTNLNPYIPGKYVCVDFAKDLNNNGEAAGIRTGYVWLVYNYINGGKWATFVNAFETTDRGLIFIEPQTDREIMVEEGKYYGGKLIKEIFIVW